MATIKSEKKYIRKTKETKQVGRPKKGIADKKIYAYSFKLSEKENELLVSKLKSSGKKDMTSFFIHLLLYQTLPVQTEDITLQKLMPLLNKVLNEINAIGANLNQITRLAHQYKLAKGVHLPTLDRAIEEEAKLNELKEDIQSIFHKIGQKWL